MNTNETAFSKDLKNRKLTVVRKFDAPLEQVWMAWTESEILDQWWAPKPYRMETKAIDFREGGSWLYAMIGPEGNRIWSIENYKTINPKQMIASSAAFCDETGKINSDFPIMHWKKEFSPTGTITIVMVEISFEKEADLEMIMKMGFQEGFTAGLGNLDQYLSAHSLTSPRPSI